MKSMRLIFSFTHTQINQAGPSFAVDGFRRDPGVDFEDFLISARGKTEGKIRAHAWVLCPPRLARKHACSSPLFCSATKLATRNLIQGQLTYWKNQTKDGSLSQSNTKEGNTPHKLKTTNPNGRQGQSRLQYLFALNPFSYSSWSGSCVTNYQYRK